MADPEFKSIGLQRAAKTTLIPRCANARMNGGAGDGKNNIEYSPQDDCYKYVALIEFVKGEREDQ